MDVLDHAGLAFPKSLPEFQQLFPNDAACASYLEKARWAVGFTCPHCREVGEPFRIATRPGILTAIAVTGGVITSAGIVLAATFLVLGVLPILLLTELGILVAFGILLDTLLVRSILVPALVYDVDHWFWWPGKLFREPVRPDAAASEAVAVSAGD